MTLEQWVSLLTAGLYSALLLFGFVWMILIQLDTRKRYRQFCKWKAWKNAKVAENEARTRQRQELFHELECERALLEGRDIPAMPIFRPSPYDDPYPDLVWR